ncbi:MAG: hypothetical protein PVG60_11350, partial [Desulfarculaceae bacterium]
MPVYAFIPRQFEKKPQRRAWQAGIVLGLLMFAAALTACGPEAAEPSPQAKAFVSQIRSVLSELTPLVVAPLVKQDAKAAEKVLSQYLGKAARNGKPPPYQVGLLDSQGQFFADPDPLSADQKMPQDAFSGRDYSNY